MSKGALTARQKDRIFEQQGFGNPNGPFWFIGMEEGGGGTLQNLLARAKFAPIEDLARAQAAIGVDIKTAKTQTWSFMSQLVLRLKGVRGWSTPDAFQSYRADRLGRAHGETFLTELLPLPSPKKSDWPYEEMLGIKRAEYEANTLPRRRTFLRGLVGTYQPRYVFCYGKSHWDDYRTLFPSFQREWCDDPSNTALEVGKYGTTRVILTPFLGNGQWKHEYVERLAEILAP